MLPAIPTFDQIVCSRDTAINREALHALGLGNRKILSLNQAKHYKCDLLITPSYIAPTGEPSPYLVELITEAVQPLISRAKNYPEKIFISRKLARSRRIINEDAIFQFFESQGYTRINLEDLPWRDQINIFYHAQEIFAPHGAGLANLIFCSRKPLVIELFNTKYLHWCFWRLAALVGARYLPIALPRMELVEHSLAAGNLDINVSNPAELISLYQSLRANL
uniref:glycosyltransferase family 61 protein n=1 Tax=Trichocoleus desertorum TaxID=1481672 RepID=UPI0025B5C34A|nr:glycosyltransferase family 61 protein [Trichocoleus desertorum]